MHLNTKYTTPFNTSLKHTVDFVWSWRTVVCNTEHRCIVAMVTAADSRLLLLLQLLLLLDEERARHYQYLDRRILHFSGWLDKNPNERDLTTVTYSLNYRSADAMIIESSSTGIQRRLHWFSILFDSQPDCASASRWPRQDSQLMRFLPVSLL